MFIAFFYGIFKINKKRNPVKILTKNTDILLTLIKFYSLFARRNRMSDTEKLIGTSEAARRLNIPLHQLEYLFKSRKLKKENFTLIDGRQVVFKESDMSKIQEALFNLKNK